MEIHIRHKKRVGSFLAGLILFIALLLMNTPNGLSVEIMLATEETDHLVVQYEPPLSNAAPDLFRVYAVIKGELERTLGWAVDFRPRVVLIRESTAFAEIAGNRNIVAFAVPGEHLIIIDYSKMGIHPFSLGITLKHEMCHLLLHRHIMQPLPRWFDEGVSQWITGGVAEILTERKPSLHLSALSGSLLRLTDLEARFPEGAGSMALAYEESKSVVEYMAKTFGREKVIELLGTMKRGETFDTALYRTLSITPAALERDWRAHLTRHISWILIFADNLYEIIFFILALITMYAFFRLLVKKWRQSRVINQADEDDDAHRL
jgi:hypothetical protein